MQLNASHVAAREGSSFLKTAPERRPRAGPCWKPHQGWGGRQQQHQPELSWKGVGAPSRGSLMGERMHCRHPRPSPQMGPDQKQSADRDQPSFPPQVSPSAEGKRGPFGSRKKRGCLETSSNYVLGEQRSPLLLVLNSWLMTEVTKVTKYWGLCPGRKLETHHC